MSGSLRFGLTIVKLGLLFSLLTGCAPKPPAAPGTSAPLVYPVLLFTEDKLKVYKDESALTTTRAATGIAYTLYTILDSAGVQYAILKVTDFDNQSGFLNMGTKSYRIFLQLKSKGTPSLDKAKATLKATTLGYDQVQNKSAADEAIGGAKTYRELVEMCGRPWDWR
jgi:hypothetical protein